MGEGATSSPEKSTASSPAHPLSVAGKEGDGNHVIPLTTEITGIKNEPNSRRPTNTAITLSNRFQSE
jgi:hypothetical protein